LYYAAGVTPDATAATATTARFAAIAAAPKPHTSPHTARSFIEDASQYQCAFDTEAVLAVNTIRKRHDPTGLFREDVATSQGQPNDGK
jgi:hypothetical protein